MRSDDTQRRRRHRSFRRSLRPLRRDRLHAELEPDRERWAICVCRLASACPRRRRQYMHHRPRDEWRRHPLAGPTASRHGPCRCGPLLRVVAEGSRGKGTLLRRGAILLVLSVSLVWSAGPAAAKGNIPARGYAVITGPGLSHPLVVVAPWKRSRGGYYSGAAEPFLGLAGGTGAIPAGRLETEAGEYVPYGVLPIDKVPSEVGRGPRYRLTWFRDGVNEVARQNIYPFASAGPLVYTFPSSRRALIVLFGRFQVPAHVRNGAEPLRSIC